MKTCDICGRQCSSGRAPLPAKGVAECSQKGFIPDNLPVANGAPRRAVWQYAVQQKGEADWKVCSACYAEILAAGGVPTTHQLFVMIAGKQVGPISVIELNQMAQGGKITPETKVRQGHQQGFSPASKIKGLRFQSNSDLPAAGTAVPATDSFLTEYFHAPWHEEKEERDWASIPLATKLVDAGNADRDAEAMKLAQQLEREVPDFFVSYNWQATLQMKIGRFDVARAAINRGLKIAKGKAALLARLAQVELQAGDGRAAIRCWVQAAVVQVRSGIFSTHDPFLYLATLADQLGLSSAARALISRADSIRAGKLRVSGAAAEHLRKTIAAAKIPELHEVIGKLVDAITADTTTAGAELEEKLSCASTNPSTNKETRVPNPAILPVSLQSSQSERNNNAEDSSVKPLEAQPSQSSAPTGNSGTTSLLWECPHCKWYNVSDPVKYRVACMAELLGKSESVAFACGRCKKEINNEAYIGLCKKMSENEARRLITERFPDPAAALADPDPAAALADPGTGKVCPMCKAASFTNFCSKCGEFDRVFLFRVFIFTTLFSAGVSFFIFYSVPDNDVVLYVICTIFFVTNAIAVPLFMLFHAYRIRKKYERDTTRQ